MTIKDLIKIFRRRILWFISSSLVVILIYLTLLVNEKKEFIAASKVIIEIPREISLLSQPAIRPYYVPSIPTLLSTWQDIITSKSVLKNVHLSLKRVIPDITPLDVSRVRVVPQEGTAISHIVATASSKNLAAMVANAVAEEAERLGKETATRDLRARIVSLENTLKEQKIVLTELEEKMKAKENEAKTINISKKVDNLWNATILINERLAEIDNKISKNEYQLKKLLKKEAIKEHLGRIPPGEFGTLFPELASSHEIGRLTAKLYEIRENYASKIKRYDIRHPDIQNLAKEIRDTEIRLTNAIEEAVTINVDKEVLKLAGEIELARIERETLGKELEKIDKEYKDVSEIYREYKLLEKRFNEISEITSKITSISAELGTIKEAQSGYITRYEPALAEEAREAEKRTTKMIPAVILVAILIGLGAIYLAEFLDTTIRSDYDVKRYTGYNLLGAIPFITRDELLIIKSAKATPICEIYDTIATMIQRLERNDTMRSFLVTSANPNEGKTVFSLNLATALAKQGKKTIIIDSDIRNPALHAFLEMDNTEGFSDFLLSLKDGEGLQTPEVLRKTTEYNLSIITSGKARENPYVLFEGKRLKNALGAIFKLAEFIIIDSAPLLRTGDALKIASMADGVILVIESGKTDQKEVSWVKHMLTNTGTRIVGTVLNKVKTPSERYYYYYYSYKGKYYYSPTKKGET